MAIVIANAILDAADKGSSPSGPESLASMVIGWQAWAAETKDIGAQTSAVLHRAARLMADGQLPEKAATLAAQEHHDTTGRSAGNGSLMRTAPLALAFLEPASELWEATSRVSFLTHHELDASEACQLWTAAIHHAVLTGRLDVRIGLLQLSSDRAGVWLGRIRSAEAAQPRDFRNNGWVVEAFQGAWSSIYHAVSTTGSIRPESLRLALENAVRGGNDTDTVAAIAGGLIGAAAGYSAIPAEWRRKLHGWGADGELELVSLALDLANGVRRPNAWPRVSAVDYSGWRGTGTVAEHPSDSGVWIGGSALLPFVGSPEVVTRGLPEALSNVSAVVSLCRVGTDEARHIDPQNHITFWLIDNEDPKENAHLDFVLLDAAKAVHQFRQEGRMVYLHCVQAESRTPTVAALYGSLLGGAAMDSLGKVSRALPNAHPNSAFMNVLSRHNENA
ncbi:ADP-ribosylglycohydrolase family protein [Arthrobacter psychrolactophilus]